MKLLARDSNKMHLQALQQRLEEQGIPSVIQGEETARMIIPALTMEPSLWIYLDSQYEDAEKLILDPEHRVTTSIDIEEFYSIQPSDDALRSQVNAALIQLGIWLGSILFGIWLMLKLVGGA